MKIPNMDALGSPGLRPLRRRRRPGLRAAVLAFPATIAMVATGTVPAHADAASANLTYRITTDSSLAIDVVGASQDWGAQVIQWDINGGSNQSWKLVPVGSTANEYKVVNGNSGQCLSIDTNGALQDGQKLFQFPCDGAAAQNWVFQPVYITALNILEYVIASAVEPTTWSTSPATARTSACSWRSGRTTAPAGTRCSS